MLGGPRHNGYTKVGEGIRNVEGRVGSEGVLYSVWSGKSFLLRPLKGGRMGATRRARKRTSTPQGIETLSLEAEWARCPGSTWCGQCGWKGA